ncbi:hypothetical protein ACFX1X_019527 [Malus domestica]
MDNRDVALSEIEFFVVNSIVIWQVGQVGVDIVVIWKVAVVKRGQAALAGSWFQVAAEIKVLKRGQGTVGSSFLHTRPVPGSSLMAAV